MTDQTGKDLTRRESFEVLTPVTVRFCDTDKLGHVNNVSIAAYFEAARCELFDRLMQQAGTGPDIDYVLVRIAIDFKREIHYPGTVEVGGRFIRMGNRSILSGYGAFAGNICFAVGEAVNVFFDVESRRSLPVPDTLRRLLQERIAT